MSIFEKLSSDFRRNYPRISRYILSIFGNSSNDFLKTARGVIHIGANSGQERKLYAEYDLNVVWIEPIPDIFHQLSINIKPYPKQIALNYLLSDKNDQMVTLHIASNDGASSSILDLHDHKELWPDVKYVDHIDLKTKTLTSAITSNDLKPENFDSIVIDTQGSELLVLQGAEDILKNISFIKTEAADFEAYKGCAREVDIVAFLESRNFRLVRRERIASRSGVGGYYDLLFKRNPA